MDNTTKKTVTHYTPFFKGIFGRNRKVKLEVGSGIEYPHGTALDITALAKLAAEYAAEIKAKDGQVFIKRYADVEIETQTEGERTYKFTTVKPFDATTAYTTPVQGGKLVTAFLANQ